MIYLSFSPSYLQQSSLKRRKKHSQAQVSYIPKPGKPLFSKTCFALPPIGLEFYSFTSICWNIHVWFSRQLRSAQASSGGDQEALFQLVSNTLLLKLRQSLCSKLYVKLNIILAGQLLGPLLLCEATYLRIEGNAWRSGWKILVTYKVYKFGIVWREK